MFKIGEYREDAGNVLQVWGREIEAIHKLYGGFSLKTSDYKHIDESKNI